MSARSVLINLNETIRSLPAAQRERIAQCEDKIWALVKEYGQAGNLAVSAVEYAIQTDYEEEQEAKH